MNQQFYELIDNTIKTGLTSSALETLIQTSQTEQQVGTVFDLPTNSEYILKRFINACMSTDPQIRQHASQALNKWVSATQIKPNAQKLIKFIIDVSNYKKGGNKKSQNEAFAIGRISTVKRLSHIVKNNSQLFESLSQILSDFPALQQQTIQVLHLISFDKILKLKFHSLSPQSKSSRFLYKLFLKTKDPKSQSIKIQDFEQILQEQTKQFPKKSIILYNFGKYLQTIVDIPMQFFRKYANKFLDNDTDKQVDIHQIYSILTVLKGFLDTVTITQQNYNTHFDKKIISVWLQQFRVLNKKMKSLALSLSIKFQQNKPQFAYKVLVDLHQQGVYLDNISVNHPLNKLYQSVNADNYWQYIYNLCVLSQPEPVKQGEHHIMEEEQNKNKKNKKNNKKQDKNSKIKDNNKQKVSIKKAENQQTQQEQNQQEQQEKPTFYNQLQYFIKLRFKQLSDECFCKTLSLLLNKFHKNEQQKQILFLCINLMNIICKIIKKKKHSHHNGKNQKQIKTANRLNKKMLLVLNKFQLTELSYLNKQQIQKFKSNILWGKKNTMKIRKQENYDASQGEIDFFNFYHCMIIYCFIYPQQIETCNQLQMVYQDLISFYSKKQLSKPQKKVKKQRKVSNEEDQQEDDGRKPIHVLTDIFISLMTKPPTFLRKSIHFVFEDIIPFLDKTDIGNLLTVITTPDTQFIQQI